MSKIDNGNVFVFCDHVSVTGCIRGAGHNGPHVFPQLGESPLLMPVVLEKDAGGNQARTKQETVTPSVAHSAPK